MDTLANVLDSVWACKECPGLAPCRKLDRAVCGDLKAKTVIVTESPDQASIKNGEYMSNLDGRKIRLLLRDLGLKLEDIAYLTYTVKCAPENRRASEDEADTCKHFLRSELEKIKPKTILCLGAQATTRVFQIYGLKYTNMPSMHNENGFLPQKVRGVTIFPLMGPSQAPKFMDFVLYRMHLKKAFKIAVGAK
jgi:uracil-DNA glycosylase family 4